MDNLSEFDAKKIAEFYNRHETNKHFRYYSQRMKKFTYDFACYEVVRVKVS